MQSDHNITKAGTKMGSLYYMSPEQVMGQDVDYRSDIYSLGILFYEMLTNNIPYTSVNNTDYEIMDCILKQNVPEIHHTNLPQEVNFIIKKSTAKNPQDRFQTAYDFFQAVESIGIDLPQSNFIPNPETYKHISNVQNPTVIQSSPVHNALSKSPNKIIYLISGIFFTIFLVIVIYILANNSTNQQSNIVSQSNIDRTKNLEQSDKFVNLNPTGKYSGTIKDGTRWIVEINDFNGTTFKGWNTIYWSFVKSPEGLKTSFDGVYDFKTGEIKMYEDVNGRKTGKFIGKFSNDGISISGEFIRYADNGTYNFNLKKE